MKKAFSLIELTCVIMIMGFLIVVISGGATFREMAKIRTAIKDFTEFKTAYNHFFARYEAIPGDFGNAYEFWPDQCSSSDFCDGDNNDYIDSYDEAFLAWLHLANSNFIKGNFQGQGYLNDQTALGEYNSPAGPLPSTLYSMVYFTEDAYDDAHYVILGGFLQDDLGYSAWLTPQQALYIDEKMDDEAPETGSILGRNGYNNGWDFASCLINSADARLANTDDLSDSEYNTNINSKECIVAYTLD